MHIPSLPANVLTSTVSQALAGFTNRAQSASGANSFESDLSSGNISGAQSFLSALQQKLSLEGSGAAGTAISTQITQLSNDLKSGNLTAAQTDFSSLKQTLAYQKHAAAGAASSSNSSAAQGSASSASASASEMAALAGYNALQQGAYAGAINLSMPANIPSLSVDM